MKKVELLAPAGNMESFYAAINAGADAVYLSGKKFGARSLATNFTNEELIEAINYAHIYNKKVYVTVNTLVYESEINDLLEYIEFLHKNNVDAIIIQDLGLINLLHQKFPNLELHASTQINTHNDETLKILKSSGIKRVVLARETSLDEVNKMNVDIEKEIFIHGALCMCYSGQCLLSSVIGGRSGNRGLCAQPCRLEYNLLEQLPNGEEKTVYTEGKYLLSTKDLCTLDNLEQILNSNIDSLKIEGRMKSKEYVYIVTSIYRKAIDNFYKTGKINITEKDINELKLIFNRNFTKGYLLNEEKNNISNMFRPNHLGINIGKVINQNNNRIKIKVDQTLRVNDGIRIIGKNDYGFIINKIFQNNKLVNEVSNDIVEIECNKKLTPNSIIVKTLDSKQIDYIQEEIKNTPKIPINFRLIGKLNKKLELTINDGCNTVTLYSNMETFKAENHPITEERIISQLSKLNDTPFRLNNIEIEIDNNILIPIKEINDLRRRVIEELIKCRIGSKKQVVVNDYKNDKVSFSNNNSINCFVKTEEQLQACIDCDVDDIYVEENLYNKYKNKYKNLVLYLPRIIKNHKRYDNEKLLVRELGSLNYFNNNKIVTDYTLNITNNYSIDYLNKYNVQRITLSTELNDESIKCILKNNKSNNLELIVYGNYEIFITKYCILKKNKKCNLCKSNNKYYLIDRKNERYQIINDGLCNNILLSSNKINLINKLDYYKSLGINHFRLQFYNEKYDEVEKILKTIYK